MCYTRREMEGGVVALLESDDTNFWNPMADLETSMSMVSTESVYSHYQFTNSYSNPEQCVYINKIFNIMTLCNVIIELHSDCLTV